jgi:hypothetical protein
MPNALTQIRLTYLAQLRHDLTVSDLRNPMSLKAILSSMYVKALQTGQPQKTILGHGLGVNITVIQGKCTLQLIRNFTAWPSPVEVKTVLDNWPYPVKAHSQSKSEKGHQRIIEIPLPVQEVIFS